MSYSSSQVQVVHHPLVQHHLSRLRDVATTSAEFRELVRRLGTLLANAATSQLEVRSIKVATPLQETTGYELSQRVGLVPILRAGLGLVDPFLDLMPMAEVWHLGLYRDEETAEPVEYYQKLPPSRPVDVAFVLDPMLATGGSATAALAVLKKWGVSRTHLVSLIAAPEGIANVTSQFPQTALTVAAIDERLNDRKFIVPGLGDAGDRQFATVH